MHFPTLSFVTLSLFAALASASPTPQTGNVGSFGSCPTPRIEFGSGFDGNAGTRFEPADRQSFNVSPAEDVATIATAICNSLANTCGADQQAQAACQRALQAARNARPEKSGAQADAFNAVFGLSTDFAAVQPLDNQGSPTNQGRRN